MLKSKYTLDSFQTEACDYIDLNINILVSAPTGSGKTAIAEYSIEKTKELFPDSRIVYTCPIKSLCNEKYHDMCLSYKSINETLGTNYQIGLMTGDIIINPDADIIIMTTEVLYNLIMGSKNFYPKCVIFDEVHYINDESRGHIWEKCIISCLTDWDCYLTLLSATIGNIDALVHWLNSINDKKTFCSVIKTERPVPLKEWVIADNKIMPIENESWDITTKYWTKQEKFGCSVSSELIKLCKQIELTNDDDPELEIWFGMPVIFFVLSKTKCEELANMLSQSFITKEEHDKIIEFYDYNLKEYESCSQFISLRKIISKGIAYHHSGLIPKIREVVEFLIKRKLIKVIFATETFAVGLNFPVKTVVITSFSKPTENGFRNLQVSEYKQMAGRAGRRFIDNVGHVIFWFYPNPSAYPTWAIMDSIINGQVNSIQSKYLIEPNYIIKTITTGKTRVLTDKSFLFYKDNKNSTEKPIIPEKFAKLYESELKIREWAKKSITYVDKNYKKLLSKLKKEEVKEFNQLIQNIFGQAKSNYEHFTEWENQIINFLEEHNLIKKNINQYELTTWGNIALLFNEINPVFFALEYKEILSDVNNVLPILSMFIDDGIKYEIGKHLEINHWENLFFKKYVQYAKICPKWNFSGGNYLLIERWIFNPEITLDEVSQEFESDVGLVVKILIKMYQIVEELLKNLPLLNKADFVTKISEQKKLLIRPPLKIESLYTK